MRLFIYKTEYMEGMMDESLIASAIVLGQVERKLLTASDIAHYTGIPRPSVIRKLGHLAEVKELRTVKTGSRVCYFFADVNDHDAIAGFLYRLRLIRKLCTAVSRLDMTALDRLYANEYAGNRRNGAPATKRGKGDK